MNVLSLFDGMSCCQIALNRAGIKYNKYYASEIKKHGIHVTQENYPNTIQLGDVTKWNDWDIEKPDLITFGSPCQDFSRGNATRDGLQGQKSSLFYTAVNILNHYAPKYFLMENVIMESDQAQIINNELGVYPIRINSSLVSAQFRDRLYWTNIPGDEIPDFFGRSIMQPVDKKIFLKDVLTSGFTDKQKARCLVTNTGTPNNNKDYLYKRYKTTGMLTIVFEDPGFKKDSLRVFNKAEMERLQTVPVGYCNVLSQSQASSVLGDGWTIDVIAHIFKGLK
jgi:DNA (cytosine-5)-methyltransferase 3A